MQMKKSLKRLAGSVALAALLTACGSGGDSPSGPASDVSSTASGGLTLAEQIAQLERQGGYPTLDRSDSIAGPDANQNGVRDDIEAWINSLNVTDLQRKALMQEAKSLQQTLLVDLTNQAALQQVGDSLMASGKCGEDRFTPLEEFFKLSDKIEAMTANTRQRAERYMQYNKARSGSVTVLPNYDTCEP
jgi:hypothetical protein